MNKKTNVIIFSFKCNLYEKDCLTCCFYVLLKCIFSSRQQKVLSKSYFLKPRKECNGSIKIQKCITLKRAELTFLYCNDSALT